MKSEYESAHSHTHSFLLSGWPDSNWRPLAPHASTLPTAPHPGDAKLINKSDSAKIHLTHNNIIIILVTY